jgi:hypothetical protein
MLKWQMSGKMGGKRFVGENGGSQHDSSGGSGGTGNASKPAMPTSNFIPASQLGSNDRTLGAQ